MEQQGWDNRALDSPDLRWSRYRERSSEGARQGGTDAMAWCKGILVNIAPVGYPWEPVGARTSYYLQFHIYTVTTSTELQYCSTVG